MIVTIIHVRIAMVKIRVPPGMGIRVVEVMGVECKKTRGEQWGHLLHVGHAAHVPRTNVLVKRRCLKEHSTVRRHAAHGGREEGREEGREGGREGGRKKGQTLRQVTVHGSGVG
jgi:hypothetical protein